MAVASLDIESVRWVVTEFRAIFIMILLLVLLGGSIWVFMKKTHADIDNPLSRQTEKIIGYTLTAFTLAMLLGVLWWIYDTYTKRYNI